MNILMLHPHDIYSNSEPWTVRITYLASEFVKRGHNVRLIYHLIDPRVSLEDATTRQEYPFTTIPAYRGQFALFAKMRSVLEFARWADVIHFQKCFAHVSVPALWAGYRLGKPVHYDWDDWEYGIYNYNPMNRFVGSIINVFEKNLPRMVDSISVASGPIKQMALDRGVPESRIFDGHVGADLDRFRPDIDGARVRAEHHIAGDIVLYLGQLHGAQYLELFLASARAVMDRGKTPTFLIVGGGERFGELFQIAEDMGVGHKVVFTGAVDHDLIPEYVAAADVAVACFADNPQVRTKSPLKICEYLAAGKAIVASEVGEVARMVGDAGILVEPGDADAIADAVVGLLDDPDRRRVLGEKARRRAESEFNWGVTAERMLTAYEMILDESRWLYWKLDKKTTGDPFLVTPSGPPRPIPASKMPPARKPLSPPPPMTGADRKTQTQPVDSRAKKKIVEPIEKKPADEKHGDSFVDNKDECVEEKQNSYCVDPPKPPRYHLGPLEPARGFVEANLDIIGALDGKVSFIGPYTVQIDPTDSCPNDCIACWCRSPLLLDKKMPIELQRKSLTLDQILAVLDDCVAMGTREIYVAGGGEPMSYPHILPMIDAIKRRGLICNLNTSMQNVDRDMVKELARMRVDYMTVSVWAASPEVYVLTHPSKIEEHFWDLKENLTHLNEIKREVPYIKTYNVLSNLNFHELKEMVDFAIDTKSESVEFTMVDTIPTRTDSLLLDDQQQLWLFEEAERVRHWIVDDEKESRVHLFMFDQFLRRISGKHTTVGEHDRTIVESLPCTVGWQFARVLANGNINACLKAHRIPTGTLFDSSFREIWTGKAQRAFRKKTNVFSKNDPWFSNIGNDPDAKCGCYKACDDLGRLTHLYGRHLAMSSLKKIVLKTAQLYLRMTGQYLH